MQLKAPNWYAWQMLPGYDGSDGVPWFSPIHVRDVTPLKTGQGLLEVSFLHVFYAEGVQDFTVRLKVLHRAERFMAGRIEGSGDGRRLAVISEIEFGWLEKFCPALLRAFPRDAEGNCWGSRAAAYLDSVYLHRPKPPPEPADPNSGTENEWLMACALRIDGYAAAAALGLPESPYRYCRDVRHGALRPGTVEARMTEMFMLQRCLMKEGVRSKTDAGWRRFRELFLELAPLPTPPAWRSERAADWEKTWVPMLSAGMSLIRRLHETTAYDSDAAAEPS